MRCWRGSALTLATPAHTDYWSDVPTALNDCDAAGDAIVNHINLIPTLTERPRPRETLRGVVIGIDERNDRLTVRLASNTTGDFKVQDALVFGAVHTGGAVELTVENIAGAKTIVGLKTE